LVCTFDRYPVRGETPLPHKIPYFLTHQKGILKIRNLKLDATISAANSVLLFL